MSVGVADTLVLEADVDVQCYPLCDAENSMEPFVMILMAFMLNRNAWSLKQIRSHNVNGCVNPFCAELSQVCQGHMTQCDITLYRSTQALQPCSQHGPSACMVTIDVNSSPSLDQTWPEAKEGYSAATQ